MKKHTIEQRMISLMSALFLCIFLFAGDNNRETDSELGAVSKQKTIVCDVYTIAQGVCSQELLQSDAAKLVRSDTPRKSDRHRWFEHFIKGSFFCLLLRLFCISYCFRFSDRYSSDDDILSSTYTIRTDIKTDLRYIASADNGK